MRYGITLDDGTRISLILFADNFWLFASSAKQLSSMFDAWLSVLGTCGWDVPLDEAT